MKNSLLMYFLLVISFISCEKRKETTSPDFDYKTYLLKNSDNVPTLNFPINSTTEEVFDVIDNYTQQDCFDKFRFNYELEDYTVQSEALEYCNSYPQGHHRLIVPLEIIENTIVFHYEITAFDDLSIKSKDYFEKTEVSKNHHFISFKIDKNFDEKKASQVLSKIIDGYLEYVKAKFETLYKIELRNANENQLHKLKDQNEGVN